MIDLSFSSFKPCRFLTKLRIAFCLDTAFEKHQRKCERYGAKLNFVAFIGLNVKAKTQTGVYRKIFG